jgi:hypothetical protein
MLPVPEVKTLTEHYTADERLSLKHLTQQSMRHAAFHFILNTNFAELDLQPTHTSSKS